MFCCTGNCCGFRFSRVLVFLGREKKLLQLLECFWKNGSIPKSFFCCLYSNLEFMDDIFVFSFETKNLVSLTDTGTFECLVSHSVHYFYA